MKTQYFIFDFDSTLTQVEALEVLAEISLKDNPRQQAILKEIKRITDRGVDGDMPFEVSLHQRLALLQAHQDDISALVEILKTKLSPSIVRNKAFFAQHRDSIYVISGGFKEFIVPVVAELGIVEQQVFANTFETDAQGNITGFDEQNVLARSDGKVKRLQQLALPGEKLAIGDGHSDYLMREAGVADKFFAYTENIRRDNILDKADHIVASFDEFLKMIQI